MKKLQSIARGLDPPKDLVGFTIGDVEYAVGVATVRQIVNPLPLTRLPNLPPAVSGVVRHRGDVVAVLDLRVHFGVDTAVSRRTKWILVGSGERTVGLVVDAVTGVFGSPEGSPRHPETSSHPMKRGVLAVAEHDGAMVFVLDNRLFMDLVEPLEHEGLLPGVPAMSPGRLPSAK